VGGAHGRNTRCPSAPSGWHAVDMSPSLPIRVEDVPSHRWEYGEVGATRRRLGRACGAKRLGIALIEIDPGRRSTPPHSHADEDEVFLVLAGGGLSYQTSGPGDVHTYTIGVDDLLWHPANESAHTLIAGDEGLTVLVAAEGSRTNITYLPRTQQFWLGPVWSPAGSAHPFDADAELGPLELPEPTRPRPPTIRSLAKLPLAEGRDGRLAYATRDARDMGSDKLVFAQDEMPPETHNTELHFHSARGGTRAAIRILLAVPGGRRSRAPHRGRSGRDATRDHRRPDSRRRLRISREANVQARPRRRTPLLRASRPAGPARDASYVAEWVAWRETAHGPMRNRPGCGSPTVQMGGRAMTEAWSHSRTRSVPSTSAESV